MKMQPETKAMLVIHIQAWLDTESVYDDLGGNLGMWQDATTSRRNANIFADSVEIAIQAMALQSELDSELND